MKIKMIIALLAMLVLAGGVSAQSDAEFKKTIVGSWEGQAEGYIHWFNFRSDGTAKYLVNYEDGELIKSEEGTWGTYDRTVYFSFDCGYETCDLTLQYPKYQNPRAVVIKYEYDGYEIDLIKE